EDGITESEDQQVLYGLLAEVMIDAEDLLLIAGLEHQPVELARRGEVAAERLLDHHPREGWIERRIDQAGDLELVQERRKRARRGGEIVKPVAPRGARAVQFLQLRLQFREGLLVVERAGDLAHAA